VAQGLFTLNNQRLNKRKGRRDAEGAKIFVVSAGFSRERFTPGRLFFAANNANGAKCFNN
jgi:hypothetical protein